jgi:filamentous hemagglutinin family protein
LHASARSAVVQTAQWSFAPQILLRVTARSKSEIAGDLAALGSFSQVEFTVTEVILNRR